MRTLAVQLPNNRSPTRTAAELFIHRQTLAYRMGRIEVDPTGVIEPRGHIV